MTPIKEYVVYNIYSKYIMTNFKNRYIQLVKWINGENKDKISGHRLKDLDADDKFLKLLKYCIIHHKILTTESQPSLHQIMYKIHPKAYPIKIQKYINQITKIELLQRPYILGHVTHDTFWKILKKNQTDLIVGGHILLNEKYDKQKLLKYNLKKMHKNSHLIVKNFTNNDTINLTKYIYYYNKQIYNSEPTNIRAKLYDINDNLFINYADKDLCFIFIIHEQYGINPEIFDKLVRQLL